MGDKSQIEWTDATWNPVTGCTKVSAGCKHCYAERLWIRLSAPGQPYEGRSFADVACHPERLEQPLRWRKPRRVFVNSMSDLFHEAVPFEFIAAVFGVMAASPQHTFQVLTKRPERAAAWFDFDGDLCRAACRTLDAFGFDRGCGAAFDPPQWPLANVWLGVSVEDQAAADQRIPLLLQCPAAVRFVSAEPLLGPIDLDRIGNACFDRRAAIRRVMNSGPCMNADQADDYIAHPSLDWVICGGESGPGARPMHPDYARSLRDQCAAAGVPFFFKQWGAWRERISTNSRLGREPREFVRLGKKAAGRLLDGREHMEYPR